MLGKALTSAVFASALIITPVTRVAADGKDFIAGAIAGGIAGALIQKNVQNNRARNSTAPSAGQATAAPRTNVAPQQRYGAPKRSSLPATQEGRQIQSALNFFGFDAGTVDGQVGPSTREAISRYQSYLGYAPTGQLTAFEQELLVSSYNRAEAGGSLSFQQSAQHPDGTRGLLKLYREDIASGRVQTGQSSINAQTGQNTPFTDL